jgi:hypothetical protein
MVQLSAARCGCVAILWVSLVSFAAITHCVASQRMFIAVSVYFIIDSGRKLLDTPLYTHAPKLDSNSWSQRWSGPSNVEYRLIMPAPLSGPMGTLLVTHLINVTYRRFCSLTSSLPGLQFSPPAVAYKSEPTVLIQTSPTAELLGGRRASSEMASFTRIKVKWGSRQMPQFLYRTCIEVFVFCVWFHKGHAWVVKMLAVASRHDHTMPAIDKPRVISEIKKNNKNGSRGLDSKPRVSGQWIRKEIWNLCTF